MVTEKESEHKCCSSLFLKTDWVFIKDCISFPPQYHRDTLEDTNLQHLISALWRWISVISVLFRAVFKFKVHFYIITNALYLFFQHFIAVPLFLIFKCRSRFKYGLKYVMLWLLDNVDIYLKASVLFIVICWPEYKYQ